SRRNATLVIPAIGASTTGGSTSYGPIFRAGLLNVAVTSPIVRGAGWCVRRGRHVPGRGGTAGHRRGRGPPRRSPAAGRRGRPLRPAACRRGRGSGTAAGRGPRRRGPGGRPPRCGTRP